MSTKTSKQKVITSNGRAPKNGASPNTTKPKKSMYEKWIEEYGIDDSKEAKMFLRACAKAYENHNKHSD